MNQKQYVDLVISEANVQAKLGRTPKHYRFCTLTRKGSQHFINLQLPSNVQDTILRAYKQGKKVRIFA